MEYEPIKKICCIGAGYVGGPTMAVLALYCPDIKIEVVDINQEKINSWNSKDFTDLPVFEPGLDEIIKKCRGKNLFFSNEIKKSISEADIIFISVNTPTKTKGIGAGYASDLKWIEASARQIAEYASKHTIIVEKSTLPVRTAETIKDILESFVNSDENSIDNQNKKSFTILSNPEFLAEGSAVNDLVNPDRVLIGGDDKKSINILRDLYSRWINPKKIIETNLWSSELSKLVANAFLAQKITSINSISALCEATGANVKEVSFAIGSDSRIGSKFLNPGPGFGGSCFKKDILNLVYLLRYYGLNEIASYWEQIIKINIFQQKRISQTVIKNLYGNISGKKIVILGFSFKANTNDTRESPSISICKDLLEEGAKLAILDPRTSKEQITSELGLIGEYDLYKSVTKASKNADAVVLLTEWNEFKMFDWESIYKLMRKPCWIFDTRILLNPCILRKIGFKVWSLGS